MFTVAGISGGQVARGGTIAIFAARVIPFECIEEEEPLMTRERFPLMNRIEIAIYARVSVR